MIIRIESENEFTCDWDIDNLPALDTIKLNYGSTRVSNLENVNIYVNGIYLKDVSDPTEYRGYTTTYEISGLNLRAGDSLSLNSNCAGGYMLFHYIEYGVEDISSDPNRNDGRKTDITDIDPSKRNLAVAKLHSGDKVQILQQNVNPIYINECDWHQIVYNNKLCYFPSMYCDIDVVDEDNNTNVTLGSDKIVSVTFKASDSDIATVTDTIDITTIASEDKTTFNYKDFILKTSAGRKVSTT